MVRNHLERDAAGRLHARPTEEEAIIPTGLVLRAIGYFGAPIPGLPFDDHKGVIPNQHGRVVDHDGIVPRRLRHRLGQARTKRHHWHQQEMRPRYGPLPPGRRVSATPTDRRNTQQGHGR